MSVREYREFGEGRLAGKLSELKKELFQLMQAVSGGKEKNHAKLKLLKKEIAKAKTVLREKELADKVGAKENKK